MKQIAVLGDLHLGRSLYGFDLSPYIQRVMWDFFEFCKHSPSGTIAVQLGDMFDRPTPTEEQRKVVAQWCNEFTRAGIPLFILVGNHDAMAKHSSASALQYLKASAGGHVWVIDRPTLIKATDENNCVNLLLLPFPSPGIYDGSEEFFEDAEQAYNTRAADYPTIAFAHLNIEGAKLGNQEFVYRGADFSLPEFDGVDQYVCGHIHKPQMIGTKVEVIGAAERLRFDETGQPRSFGFIEVTGDAYSLKRFLRHTALNLVELEVDASGMTRPDMALTTDEVISDIAKADINRAIIKLTPFVDKHTAVDWGAVQNWLYSDGAIHVHIASPVQVTDQPRVKKHSRVSVRDPEKAAMSFIKGRVSSKKERIALLSMFVQALREVDDAD